METLLTAEKHSHPGRAVNGFRRLLACDALPLLGTAPVELNTRLSLRLLCKAIEFYLAYIQQPQDALIQNPWDRLFQIVEIMGKKLGWELSSLFSMPWSREAYSERLQQYAASHNAVPSDELVVKQLLMCTIVVLLRLLNEHAVLMNNDETMYCLVEAFGDGVHIPAGKMLHLHHNNNYKLHTCISHFVQLEAKLKKRKREDNGVIITSDNDYSGNGLALAVKLWDLLHSTDPLQREISKLIQQLRLDAWLNVFLTDLAMYKGLHHEVLARLSKEGGSLSVNLRLAGTNFFLKNYKVRYNCEIVRSEFFIVHREWILYTFFAKLLVTYFPFPLRPCSITLF